MIEAGSSSSDDDPPAAQPPARHDFAHVQGFQAVGAEERDDAQTQGETAWSEALRLELGARAARFHQAVDAAIMLSNDGVIRWLGDPVARLSLGADLLNPGAVILADQSLPAASRDLIKTRIELWVAATTRRVLAPLFALEAIQDGPEIVRDLAHQLARSLGILEREPIRTRIRALDQNGRAELRKLGVRFGAYYLFVPALVKPAPRTLALQLWSLQAPGDAGELLRTLGPIASSGRTSLSPDGEISKEGYRVAGYRRCGERIVRVDVVERLAGMIRAAIVNGPAEAGPRPESHRASKGFVVSGQMTSLTGCSGEPFASILRSLGFKAIEVRRSDFYGSQSPEEPLAQSGPPAPAQTEEPTTHDETPAAATPELGDPGLDLPAPPPAAVPADPAPSHSPADRSGAASGADAGAETVSARTSGASPAETIVVWRPALRRVQSNRGETGSEQSRGGAASLPDAAARSPFRPNRARGKKRRRESPLAATRPPGRADRPDAVQADEKRRQEASGCDMPQPHPATEPQRKAKVDPNSPFAKLLELRSRLEEQANKRS